MDEKSKGCDLIEFEQLHISVVGWGKHKEKVKD